MASIFPESEKGCMVRARQAALQNVTSPGHFSPSDLHQGEATCSEMHCAFGNVTSVGGILSYRAKGVGCKCYVGTVLMVGTKGTEQKYGYAVRHVNWHIIIIYLLLHKPENSFYEKDPDLIIFCSYLKFFLPKHTFLCACQRIGWMVAFYREY